MAAPKRDVVGFVAAPEVVAVLVVGATAGLAAVAIAASRFPNSEVGVLVPNGELIGVALALDDAVAVLPNKLATAGFAGVDVEAAEPKRLGAVPGIGGWLALAAAGAAAPNALRAALGIGG